MFARDGDFFDVGGRLFHNQGVGKCVLGAPAFPGFRVCFIRATCLLRNGVVTTIAGQVGCKLCTGDQGAALRIPCKHYLVWL